MENERDEEREKTQVARLATVAVSDAKARAEDDLVRIQEALTIEGGGQAQGRG